MTIEPPTVNQESEFRTAVLEWMITVAGLAHEGNVFVPDDFKDYTEEGAFKLWLKVTSKLFEYQPAKRKGIEILFDYLAPWVEGVEDLPKAKGKDGKPITEGHAARSERWIRDNLNIRDALKIMVMILCIDQCIKKNVRSLLGTIFPELTALPSSPKSSKQQEPRRKKLATGPVSLRGFGRYG